MHKSWQRQNAKTSGSKNLSQCHHVKSKGIQILLTTSIQKPGMWWGEISVTWQSMLVMINLVILESFLFDEVKTVRRPLKLIAILNSMVLFTYHSLLVGWTEKMHFSSTTINLVYVIFFVYVVRVFASGSTIDSSTTQAILEPTN